jgi:hypothetical protein
LAGFHRLQKASPMNLRLPRAGQVKGYVVIVIGLPMVLVPVGLVVVFLQLARKSENRVYDAKELARLSIASHHAQDQHGHLPPIVSEYAGKKGTIIYH